ncbi:MAG: GntR family transcriptional regulator [Actinomycetota bacterium]
MASEDDDRQPSRRIADEITLAVVSGAIAPGEQLPSTTVLMERYGVANQTVQNAKRVLKDLGLIYTVRGQGTFVRSDINPADFESVVAEVGSPLFREILSRLDVIGGEISEINRRLAALEDQQAQDSAG